MNTTQKNFSVIMAGLSGLIVLSNFIARIVWNNLPYENVKNMWYWMGPVCSLATPILFGWIGILLRQKWPSPPKWVQAVLALLVPAIYILWTMLHQNGTYFFGDGDRCIWAFMGILFYLIPPSLLERYKNEKGHFELLLFVGSIFCYVGISRVVNHFSVVNFQMLTGEWTRLFCRAMTFIPLAMGIYFLAAFAFSKVGQKIGSSKGVGITTQILASISFLVCTIRLFGWGFYSMRLFSFYKFISQPVTVYLLVVASRALKGCAKRSKLIFSDLF